MIATAIRRAVLGSRGPLDDFWYRPTASKAAGVSVDDQSALCVSTFWACLRVLSDTVGCLPWHVYKWIGEQEREKATEHDWYATLHDRPNAWQTPIDWRSMAVGHLCLRGNFYCRVDGPSNWTDGPALVPLNPDRMKVSQARDGSLTYTYKYQAGEETAYRQDQILHVKLMSLDGLVGSAPLTYARETLGLSIAQQRHAGAQFSGGGFLKYYLKTTKRLGDEGRKNFRKGWRDLHGDPSKFEPPILEDDMSIETLGMNNTDLQWLESRRFGAYEVCQYLGVPPHLVFLLDRATFSNIEHQGIEFSTIHLNPWLVRLEQGVQPWLGSDYYAEFNRDAIVRGDLKSRYDAYSVALGGRPFATQNEVRARENLPPVDGGDEILEPLNMAAPGPRGKQESPKQEQQQSYTPKEDPEDDSEPEKAATVNQLAIQSAAKRIVAAEVRGIGKRADKAKQDVGKFSAWASEWFGKHERYVAETLTPLGFTAATAATFAAGYCHRSAMAVSVSEAASVLSSWDQDKAAILAADIERSLCHV